MWDCVEKLAKRAHQKGLDTLVDEDLTEFLFLRDRFEKVRKSMDQYPTCNPRERSDLSFPIIYESARR